MPLAMGLDSMPTFPPRRRFMRLAFRRRKWLLGPLVRSTLPVPEMWKRFFAPLWVLSLGIVQLCNTRPCGLQTGAYHRCSVSIVFFWRDFEGLGFEIRRIV